MSSFSSVDVSELVRRVHRRNIRLIELLVAILWNQGRVGSLAVEAVAVRLVDCQSIFSLGDDPKLERFENSH